MTLTATTVKSSHDGDGSTTAFTVGFVFWDDSDLQVIHTDSSDTETTWTLNTHYTVSGGSGADGTVTTTTGNTVASGATLTIKSNRADTQPTSFTTGGPFPAAAVELSLDQLTRMVQQFAEEIARTIQFAASSTDTGNTMPDHTGNADKILVVNSAGTGFTLAALASLDSSALTTPVTLANGGAAADLATLTALDYIRMNSGATALEGRSMIEVMQDLYAKGGDIASADPLVIDTDGHYFDVTGTTTFDGQTVAAGRFYILQFDGALTMTDDADHDLGGADIATFAGCRGLFYAIAADTVQLVAPFFFEGDQRRVDSAGAVTNAVQPAFRATNAALTNVTGGGTDYTIVFATEVYDQNSDFDGTSTFTAPATGRYLLTALIRYTGIAGATADAFTLNITTSNDVYSASVQDTNGVLTGDFASVAIVADMDAADTATVHFVISGATDTADIAAGDAHFSGCLLT